jgi:phosphoserine phosphatase
MQLDDLNVFDLDGTLIKVNSFKEISRKLAFTLLQKLRIAACLKLLVWYLIRKLCIISHLYFKRQVVGIFENYLTEKEKQSMVHFVFDNNINKNVYDLMQQANNCVISTSAPYAYTSRMCFNKKDLVVISSLTPHENLADIANFGEGKVRNITAYFNGKDFHIISFYTDCNDDQPLIDISNSAYLVRNGTPVKIK